MIWLKRKQAWILLLALWWLGVLPPGQAQFQKAASKLIYPNGLALDARGELFISDIGAHCVFKLARNGRLIVVAGTGEAGFGGDGGPATQARLRAPHDLLFDAEGCLVIADTGNQRIRRIDRSGVINTLAGDGRALQSNYNGAVPPASLNNPQGLALARDGSLLIADTYNHVVRRLERDGKLTIVAGSVAGYGGDGGPAIKAQINLPMAVAVAPDGGIYISDAGNSRLRRVAPDGNIRTVAGFGPPQDTYGGGYAGDGGPAQKAKLFSATALKIDALGRLLIADSGNHRVRMLSDGIINTVAGNGEQGFSGEGQAAVTARLNTPQKIALGSAGSLFIADRANQCVRKVDAQGIVRTVVGPCRPAGKLFVSTGKP